MSTYAAEELDRAELVEQCAKAYEEEQEHLEKVRTWLSQMILSEAGEGEMLAETEADDDGEKSKRSNRSKKKSSSSNKKRKK